MAMIVHHYPANTAALWKIHIWQAVWDGNNVWGLAGTSSATIDFQLPDTPDSRKLQFRFHSISRSTGLDTWESGDFTRRLRLISPTAVWTFESSPRILYQNPFPSGVAFKTGDVLTFQAITQKAFRGGRLYVWNPYRPDVPSAYFGESARDDEKAVSTFRVTLTSWMTAGFNLKLMQPGKNDQPSVWEPDSSNRVWRPYDGNLLWLKSGQCDLREAPLQLTPIALEVLYGSNLPNPPEIKLKDTVEGSIFPLPSSSVTQYSESSLFNVAAYRVPIYPDASYTVKCMDLENPPIERPFPADPTVLNAVSRFVLGAGAWVNAFPTVRSVPFAIKPQSNSSFSGGLGVQISLGNGPFYQHVSATRQDDGTYRAEADVAQNTTTAIDMIPTVGEEPRPYAWIDTSRYFTPTANTTTLYTTEGVYGICERGPTQFANPANRPALMQAAFGAVATSGIFAAREMPQGATIMGKDVYFVVHAPHATCATLIAVDDPGAGKPLRKEIPMSLTDDTFYWWCKLPVAQVPPGTRYRFLLNDDVEVIDPAARAVVDGGSLKTSVGEDPADPSTSWSVVLNVSEVSATAHVQPWQTMGWQNLLIYEIHARRFTNLKADSLTSFDLLADELNATSRLGQAGYLRQLPATVFGLMPVTEFSSVVSWGYDPSFYFAIDSFYGGAPALARFVNAAHSARRGVMLDVVFNHSLGSSLMRIAPDVYRNGDYYGDRMNCGHPMVGEYFRQASIYLFRTFNLDGFRFDDTRTITTQCQGGWDFLGMIRASLRVAASAEGRGWPYCVAENSATKPWDISDPFWGVLDGQWDIDEVYRIRDASYDSAHPERDDSAAVKAEMDNPNYWGRPFFQATRFGESHDMVSGQDPLSIRIAARPPFGQGYQLAKALGTLTLLSNGIPMLFMGQEIGETTAFSFDNNDQWVNPQLVDVPRSSETDQTRILFWFRQIMGLRNDPTKGLQGDTNYQVIATGKRTVAFVCGANQRLFTVITFGTPNQQQNSSWLGLPQGIAYKEIFNSSWPIFQVESEQEQPNGGYDARIYSGQILNLPWIGAIILERR